MNPAEEQSLERLRAELDRLDETILDLIEQRLAGSRAIADRKAAEGDRRLKIRPRRPADVVKRLQGKAERATPALVAAIWTELMAQSWSFLRAVPPGPDFEGGPEGPARRRSNPNPTIQGRSHHGTPFFHAPLGGLE